LNHFIIALFTQKKKKKEKRKTTPETDAFELKDANDSAL
jgi:hypothetical protein